MTHGHNHNYVITSAFPYSLKRNKFRHYPISTSYSHVPVPVQYDPEGDDNDLNNKKRKKIKGLDPKDMTDEQRLERRYEHTDIQSF